MATSVEAVMGRRHEAVERVYAALEADNPGLFERMGERGREATREDLHYHLDFLQAALELASPDYFASYATWTGSVLAARGLRVEGLRESLEYLEAYFFEALAMVDARAVSEALRAGVRALEQRSGHLAANAADTSLAPLTAQPLVSALVQGDRSAVWNEVETLMEAGASYTDLAVNTVQPALYEVGRQWQHHVITVAQEHLATSQAIAALTKAFARSEAADDNGRKALFACVEGNRHSVGLMMLSDSFALRGWRTQFLGADVPTRDLLAHVDAFAPELLALSLAMPDHFRTARRVIEKVRADFGAKAPTVLVGGLPLNEFEGIWSHLGADGWSPDAARAAAQFA